MGAYSPSSHSNNRSWFNLYSALQDPRMIDVLGVLMGVDMQGFSRPEGSDELPPGVSSTSPPPASSPPPKASTSTPAPPPPAEDVEMTEVDDEEATAKKEAEAAKKAGAEAYKIRQFDEAIKQFEKAWEIWPQDITFLTNLAGKFAFIFSPPCTDFVCSRVFRTSKL